jgi:hypothetical protein
VKRDKPTMYLLLKVVWRSQRQLEYVLVKQRFRTSVKDVQTLPGADIDSDHNLLVATKFEENHKVPQAETKMGFGEAIRSTTGSTL